MGEYARANPVVFAVLVLLLAVLALAAYTATINAVRDVRRVRWDAYRARWIDEREADRADAAWRDSLPDVAADTGFTDPPTSPPRRYRPLREGEHA